MYEVLNKMDLMVEGNTFMYYKTVIMAIVAILFCSLYLCRLVAQSKCKKKTFIH